MDLCTELRTATTPIHTRVENLPLAQAMVGGTVTRDDYVALLQHLLAAHRGWEAAVDREPAVAAIWDSSMARAAVLERDLIALGADPEPADHPAIQQWLAGLDERAESWREVWIGVVYLFEGSRMGSMALLRPVARAMGVEPAPDCGVDYHLDGGIAERMPRWRRLQAALNGLPLTADQRHAAVWGAVAAFQMLHDVYAAPAPVAALAG